MVLRRTLPSRVSADKKAEKPASKDAAPKKENEAQPPRAEKPETLPADAAVQEADRAAALADALDEDFPSPQASQAGTSLEESFAAFPSAIDTPPQETPAARPADQTQSPQEAPTEEPVMAAAEGIEESESPVVAEGAAPTDLTPSRPDAANPLKRKVREKKPRNFAFKPAEENRPVGSEDIPPVPADTQSPPPAEDPVETPDADPRMAGERLSGYGVVAEAPDALTSGAVPAPAVQTDSRDFMESDHTTEFPTASIPADDKSELAPDTQPETTEDSSPIPSAPTQETSFSFDTPEETLDKQEAETPPATHEDQKSPEEPESPETRSGVQPTSDLPWVADAPNASENTADDWSFGAVPSPQEDTAPDHTPDGNLPKAEQPVDIYAPQSTAHAAPAGLPPVVQQSMASRSGPAPELPKAGGHPRQLQGSHAVQWGIGALVVTLVAVGVYQLVKNDESQERVARWTGALTETTEKLPPEMGGVQPNPQENLVSPEQIIAMDDTAPGILPPPPVALADRSPMPSARDNGAVVVDFADVPPDEAGKPIKADGTEEIPEDIGLIARFQEAVAAEKARQSGGAPDTATPPDGSAAASGNLTPAEKQLKNTALQMQLQQELAAYRETLASVDKTGAPKPAEFLGKEKTATPPAETPKPTLPPPPAAAADYAPNPAGLPTLPEPAAATRPAVRTLADFDVDMFASEKERVRIPKGIKPRFSMSEFPEMEVLSFVPGRGIIAFTRGREGVLLIGESLEGWELVNVGPDSAEFRNGRRSQYVSAE